MSDTKKPEQKADEKPLKNPFVNVNVTPQNEKNRAHVDAARTLKKKLEENIKKAVEKNSPGGQEKQFTAAKEETKRAAKDANPQEIKEVKVNVAGTDKDGDTERRAWSVPTSKPSPP
jgi:broad specificity polyphosphatase/5'/3'-nucleotidase SurE